VTELASTMTPGEIASQAAHAIRVLNELTPQLCEHLARFLVIQHEDGQLAHDSGDDPDGRVTEVIEALTAAGQAADMMTAALTEARAASASLNPVR